jgi:hypothetical protein
MNKKYAGIDYSGPGSTINRDPETGIRYGVISQHSIQSDVMSDIWGEARDLSYEQAKEELLDSIMRHVVMPRDSDGETRPERWRDVKAELRDLWYGEGQEMARNEATEEITAVFDSEGKDGREAVWEVISDRFNDRYDGDGHDWLWEKDGYTLSNCLQSDVFVSKSPYFTYAPYCSPCCPGAGNLDSIHVESCHEKSGYAKCFCLDGSFFDDGRAPYPMWRVDDGSLVDPGTDESKTAQ